MTRELALQRHGDLVATGAALPGAAPEQLAADPPRGVELRGDHVKATPLAHPRSEANVRAAAGHVGRHRDLARFTGLGHDGRFLLVVSRVEHPVREAGLVEPE